MGISIFNILVKKLLILQDFGKIRGGETAKMENLSWSDS